MEVSEKLIADMENFSAELVGVHAEKIGDHAFMAVEAIERANDIDAQRVAFEGAMRRHLKLSVGDRDRLTSIYAGLVSGLRLEEIGREDLREKLLEKEFEAKDFGVVLQKILQQVDAELAGNEAIEDRRAGYLAMLSDHVVSLVDGMKDEAREMRRQSSLVMAKISRDDPRMPLLILSGMLTVAASAEAEIEWENGGVVPVRLEHLLVYRKIKDRATLHIADCMAHLRETYAEMMSAGA